MNLVAQSWLCPDDSERFPQVANVLQGVLLRSPLSVLSQVHVEVNLQMGREKKPAQFFEPKAMREDDSRELATCACGPRTRSCAMGLEGASQSRNVHMWSIGCAVRGLDSKIHLYSKLQYCTCRYVLRSEYLKSER